MAEDYAEVNETPGGARIHTRPVTVSIGGVPTVVKEQVIGATTLDARYGGGKSTGSSGVIAASGDTVLVTPAAGQRLTLYWIHLVASQENSAEVLATVRLGARVVYVTYLGAQGVFAHWEPEAADAVDDDLVLNLSAAGQSVVANFTTAEGA